MGGQQHRGTALTVDRLEELSDRSLADDIEADRRLIKVDHLRVMEQGGGQVAAHSLPQTKLADGRVEQVRQFEQADETVEVPPIPQRIDPVEPPNQVE
jgi:hypothetical protein